MLRGLTHSGSIKTLRIDDPITNLYKYVTRYCIYTVSCYILVLYVYTANRYTVNNIIYNITNRYTITNIIPLIYC